MKPSSCPKRPYDEDIGFYILEKARIVLKLFSDHEKKFIRGTCILLNFYEE
jgi:hypothetical protein